MVETILITNVTHTKDRKLTITNTRKYKLQTKNIRYTLTQREEDRGFKTENKAKSQVK